MSNIAETPKRSLLQILVVEPDATFAKSIEDMLSSEREAFLKTESVPTLKAAVNRVSRGDVQAVLLNLFLPDSKGLETLEAWTTAAPQIPVVVLFDQKSVYLLPEALRRGVRDYLVKSEMDGRLLSRVLIYAIDRKTVDDRIRELSNIGLEYVRIVSHELRAPLSITREGVSLVLDSILGKINDKQEQVLKIAKRNIDRLDHIIMNMLDISKLDAGKMEIRREPVDLMELVKHIVASFEERSKEKGLTIRAIAPHETVWVYADKQRILEVLAHLVGNAVKFTKEGTITISLRETDEEAICDVADTGVGISREDRPKMFGKFQQFGWAPGGGEKGMGLGLAIVKGIIELHAGEIGVDSEPGKGTKVSFTLQRYKTPVPKRR